MGHQELPGGGVSGVQHGRGLPSLISELVSDQKAGSGLW